MAPATSAEGFIKSIQISTLLRKRPYNCNITQGWFSIGKLHRNAVGAVKTAVTARGVNLTSG